MKLLLFLSIIFFSSCFTFSEKRDMVYEYKLNSTKTLKVYTGGFGATTPGYTEIIKTEGDRGDEVVKRFDFFSHEEKIIITRVNDTLFKITFTSTSPNLGRISKSYNFSINDKVKD
jgi:hypothetical protein